MKKLFIILAITISLAITIPAIAGSPYVSLKGLLGTTNTGDIKISHIPEGLINATNTGSSDTAESAGFAIGYDTGDVRFEFEYVNRLKVEHDTSLAILNGGITIDGTYIPFNDPSFYGAFR